jgi:carbonic anhydrase
MYSISIVALVAFFHLHEASASCVHNTHLHPRSMEEDGQTVQVSNFSYLGDTGPTNWHALKKENKLCATGRYQSPINIETAGFMTTNPGDVQTEIPAKQSTTFENLGTNVEVVVEGTTTVDGKKFKLKQFHYHSPGEHWFDEEYYPVEVHMVHEAEGC